MIPGRRCKITERTIRCVQFVRERIMRRTRAASARLTVLWRVDAHNLCRVVGCAREHVHIAHTLQRWLAPDRTHQGGRVSASSARHEITNIATDQHACIEMRQYV